MLTQPTTPTPVTTITPITTPAVPAAPVEPVPPVHTVTPVHPVTRDRPDRPSSPVHPDAHASPASPLKTPSAFHLWMRSDVHPNAFLTIPIPSLAWTRPLQHYLTLWTRKAESALWGASALKLGNPDDRCQWIFVKETLTQAWSKRAPTAPMGRFAHVHALVRMPARLMKKEHRLGYALPIEDRCRRLAEALIEASRSTPAPFAKRHQSGVGAAVDVRPYRDDAEVSHATYLLKQLRGHHRDHWSEAVTDGLRQEHGLFFLPRAHHAARRSA